MKWQLTRPVRPIDRPDTVRPTAVVWVDAPDPDTDGTLVVECDDDRLRSQILTALDRSYGDRGRPLHSEQPFSPRDLACAVTDRWMKPFEAREL